VATRRKITADTRNSTFAWLDSKGYKYIPSVSNCFMIDTGRPGRQVMAAMMAQDVYIGRVWPIWPNHVRITVGTPAEMAKFQTAFEKVMSTPA
jgi:histidinol-phosphate aminotransferase